MEGKKRKSNRKGYKPFKPIPQSMKICLRSRTYETTSGSSSPFFYRYGLVEFLSRTGSYIDSFFGLYNLAIIHGCRITLRLVNMSSEPLILAVAPLPYSWASGSPTVSELLDCPRAVRRTAGGNGGQDKAQITSAHTVRSLLGKEYNISTYQMTAAQAASSTPLYVDEPCWTVAVTAFNASSAISYRLEVELEFSTEFYSLDSR